MENNTITSGAEINITIAGTLTNGVDQTKVNLENCFVLYTDAVEENFLRKTHTIIYEKSA